MARRKQRKEWRGEQDRIVLKALNSKRESKTVEFKSEFDPTSRGAWCEILKDVVAMANSGGGAIVFGLEGGGRPSGVDIEGVLGLDPAEVVDQVFAYTGVHFAAVDIIDGMKGWPSGRDACSRSLGDPACFHEGRHVRGGRRQAEDSF